IIKNSLKWGFVILIWLSFILSFLFIYYSFDLPEIDKLNKIQRVRKVTIITSNNEVLTNFGDLYGQYVKYSNIPKNLINAVLATEDRRFFKHFGVDILGVLRAAYVNYRAGKIIEGGSTITQQLVKMILLKPEKTIKRK